MSSGTWFLVLVINWTLWMQWIYGGGHAEETPSTFGLVFFFVSTLVPAFMAVKKLLDE